MSAAGVVYDNVALIDSCAVIALFDQGEQFHEEAKRFLDEQQPLTWAAVDVTSHEVFTRIRYKDSIPRALEHFDFLRAGNIKLLAFTPEDEVEARAIIEKYSDHRLSFHDALCAAIMMRVGIYKIFTFDRDFWIMGFQVVPGKV